MDIDEIYHFLFETMPGIGCLVGAGLVLSVIACIIMERRTRKQFKNHEKTEDDWSLFDDDDEEDSKEFDSLMPEVLKCVIESGSASTSMIQRRFSVGYARASRIIDQMEQHKFIGPLEGSKPRAVYISREQYKELFGTDL